MSNALRQHALHNAMSRRQPEETTARQQIVPMSVIDGREGSWTRWLFWADDEVSSYTKDKQPRQVFFHPFSRFAQSWEFVSGILLIYSASVTPLLIAFFTEEQGHCGLVPTIYMDILVDTFFLLEIVIHFFTGTVRRGQINLEMQEVARTYMMSDFPRDLVASVPIAWLEFFLVPDVACTERSEAESSQGSTLLFMRFIRMLKMLRLIKVLKIFNVMRDLCQIRPATIRLVKAGFMVFLMSHIGGCLWWFIKVQEDPQMAQAFLVDDGTENSIPSIYISAVYFMMATLCTVGYGDISASGEYERLFSILTMCLGTSVFAIIVSNMSALAAGMQSRENQVLQEMDNVLDFMRQNGVGKVFERQVQSYYLFKCRQNEALGDGGEQVLQKLPPALAREIKVDLSKRILASVWLFDGLSPDELASVVALFTSHQAIPGEVVVSDEEEPGGLLIVVQGQVRLEVPQREGQGGGGEYQEMDRLGKGEVLGEVGVILRCASPYRARAVGFVEVYRLSREALEEELFAKLPDLEARLREGAEEKLAEYGVMRELQASGSLADRWARLARLLLRASRSHADAGVDRLTRFATHQKRHPRAPGPRRADSAGAASGGWNSAWNSDKDLAGNPAANPSNTPSVATPAHPHHPFLSPDAWADEAPRPPSAPRSALSPASAPPSLSPGSPSALADAARRLAALAALLDKCTSHPPHPPSAALAADWAALAALHHPPAPAPPPCRACGRSDSPLSAPPGLRDPLAAAALLRAEVDSLAALLAPCASPGPSAPPSAPPPPRRPPLEPLRAPAVAEAAEPQRAEVAGRWEERGQGTDLEEVAEKLSSLRSSGEPEAEESRAPAEEVGEDSGGETPPESPPSELLRPQPPASPSRSWTTAAPSARSPASSCPPHGGGRAAAWALGCPPHVVGGRSLHPGSSPGTTSIEVGPGSTQ